MTTTPEAMTIRDEFAIRVLASVIATAMPASDEEVNHCIKMAYKTADTMMLIRNRRDA